MANLANSSSLRCDSFLGAGLRPVVLKSFSSKDQFKAQEKSGWFLQSLVQICPSYAAILGMHWVHGVAIDV
ncbi:hypothetical protein RHSIM_Rhsim03G0033700 [Rhododendron simsii]|uniref:Uncharacterized protein n=1 Tax=Rhododendron simsii TaxID=118357 RepID=A0A834H718_RHOSS|nr:hypothetical protein RHSIM_Rhsim03G0033700 [Rhododendron simsii]